MAKHKILLQGNYGAIGKLPKCCIDFIKSKGGKYPEILNCRHDPILIKMFEKFAEIPEGTGRKILYILPVDGMGSYRGYYKLAEIDSDMYCIVDYDGTESVKTINDFDWIQIK